MSDKLRKSQFHYKGDKRRSYLTAKMHDYFEEAEKVIESINISEEINNANNNPPTNPQINESAYYSQNPSTVGNNMDNNPYNKYNRFNN